MKLGFRLLLCLFAGFVTVSQPADAIQLDPTTGRPLEDVGVYSSRHQAPRTVAFAGDHGPGTIVVDTTAKELFLVLGGGKARRYSIGVGREGKQFSGTFNITRKAEWPGWTPTAEMRAALPTLPNHMEGGPMNPLGARALYIGSTLYRIHGTNVSWSVGREMSSGCIRMTNEDVIDLYDRVPVGARVVVQR
ncbi:L,D-transpeptidase [Lutibaculum baratangense]|uniref:ErfK/YbiS/YcfS/YnhG n=1 Tax=Lutibaculum baratangense AMV1 TaxID=631454 RepID=V4RBZ9_9HYPH|nr:L,D-transpeptidase [Lutibaculum baratangense]ESR22884.1 ErfK/YbiS/YcfS/YnhG [Lutibaculum baratangense AMV1]